MLRENEVGTKKGRRLEQTAQGREILAKPIGSFVLSESPEFQGLSRSG